MSEGKSGGMGFVGLLQLLLIGLKITGYITASWFWVLMPIWGSVLVALGVVGVAFFILMKGGGE